MARMRVSTTVDGELLGTARRMRGELSDAALIDEALKALVDKHRSAEIDATYCAYDTHPLNQRDEWGNLEAFRDAAGSS